MTKKSNPNKRHRVNCRISRIEVKTDAGETVKKTVACCGRCQKKVAIRGITIQAERKALRVLNKKCPKGESNFYVREPY